MTDDSVIREHKPFWRVHGHALVTVMLSLAILTLYHFLADRPWIGEDNDDAMRLVQVRDLLAGQGWFDLTQYRLGPEGGSSMHWSRLVDAPIAALALLFSLFLTPELAEKSAVFIWPLLTAIPVLFAMSVAARRLGGEIAVFPAVLLTAFFVCWFKRFAPGAIDHHNVQLALTAILFAALLDRRLSPGSYRVAAIAAALAIAIGAETLPLVGLSCAWVAVLWIIYGDRAVPAISAFAFAFCVALSVLFFATVPPAQYGAVQCDAYSIGQYLLGMLGAAALYLTVNLTAFDNARHRFTVLAVLGIAIGALVYLVAPQCLTTTIYSLDPLLRELWLNNVAEAHSVVDYAINKPTFIAGFYIVPFIAIGFCIKWCLSEKRTPQLVAATFLLGCSLAIALFQVRGSLFALMLANVPMAVMIARFRAPAIAKGARPVKMLAYLGSILVSIPLVWFLAASAVEAGIEGSKKSERDEASIEANAACKNATALQPLTGQAPGVVAGISNLGAWTLLYTPHRVLSAPYHRNHSGMLAALRIGTLPPAESYEILREHNVDWLVFCPRNTETNIIVDAATDGLYAQLQNGNVPSFLERLSETGDSELEIYRFKP